VDVSEDDDIEKDDVMDVHADKNRSPNAIK
jgi:hypothetical protein